MRERELWELTVDVLDAFSSNCDKSSVTVEEIAEEAIRHAVGVSPEDEVFVIESATGTTRFMNLCDGALQGYCAYLKRNRADKHSMHLMAYIIIFKYTDYGGEKVRQLFNQCTSNPRIEEYVEYLLNPTALQEHSYPVWLQHYDKAFLDTSVLQVLANIKADADAEVVEWFRTSGTAISLSRPRQLDGTGGASATVAATTTVTTLDADDLPKIGPKKNISEKRSDSRMERSASSRARVPPAEVREMAYTIPEARHPPVSTAVVPVRRSDKPLTSAIGFSFHHRLSPAASPREHIEPTVAAVPKPSYEKVVAMLEKDVTIPTTTAALLREAHVHQKRQEDEDRALTEKEINPHDASAYEQWRRDEQAKDERMREIVLLERHMEELKTAEKVNAARAEMERERRKAFQSVKESAKAGTRMRSAENKKRLEQQKSYVQTFRQEMVKSRREAEEKALLEKLSTAVEVKKESAELKAIAKAAEEQQRREQLQIIEEIQLLRQRLKSRREDIAETNRVISFRGASDVRSDDGLERLTLRELKDELVRVRDEELEERQRKKERIVSCRVKEQDDRKTLMKQCQAQREKNRLAREAARAVKEEQKAAVRQAKLEVETAKMLQLHDKLETRRQQRRSDYMKMCDGERERQNDLLLRAADDSALEKERWRQLEQGVINSITSNQITNVNAAGRRK